jgi:hypothetical protein
MKRPAQCLCLCGLFVAGCSQEGRSPSVDVPPGGDSSVAGSGAGGVAPNGMADPAIDVEGTPVVDARSMDASVDHGPLTLAFQPLALDPSITTLTDFVFLPDDTILATSRLRSCRAIQRGGAGG